MSLLGIDYGAAKIGFAIAEGQVASPLRVVRYENPRELREAIQRACAAYDVQTVVVGMPGAPRAADVAAFVAWLRRELSMAVVTEDERLTTKFAQRLMRGWKGKADDDAIAAALMLQTYIERQANNRQPQALS